MGIKDISIGGKAVKKITIGGGVYFEAGGLPSIYQRCAYVSAESSNGAYIDLGFTYAHGCTVEIGFIYQGENKNLQIFGAAESSGRYRCALSAGYLKKEGNQITEGAWYSTRSNLSFIEQRYYSIDKQIGDEVRHRVQIVTGEHLRVTDLDDGKFDSGTTTTVIDFTMTRNLYLLGQNYNTGYRGNGLKQVTYFKYWDYLGNPVCDLIPCYHKTQGTIGFYDLIRKIFLTNAGSGSFTKGADVN